MSSLVLPAITARPLKTPLPVLMVSIPLPRIWEDPEQDLNSVRNEVTLCEDLNGQGLDQGLFLFVPYADRVVAAVFAKTMAQDLAHEYHLRAIDFPTRIRRGYLFIRFAWNVLKFLTPGLADAAAAIHPRKSAQMAEASSSRNAPMTQAGQRWGRGGGGGASGALATATATAEHGESALTPEDEDEAQLAVFETLDAALKSDSPLTVDDVQAGRHPGLAGIKRLEREYRRAHPLVSAVGDARIWEEGDDD
ncbi:hypothetical protein B0H14DRAFT_3492389 [Mycena olivaceomarginata]|nr:hypothetical protein B0H14DRAFT_3492389 [Mycena olivaceomarginata]